MKKFMITALAAATMLNNAHAVRVLSSEQATLEKNGREVARAFRDREACRAWYWMPRVYNTYTDARHYLEYVTVKIPGVETNETGLVSQFEFGVEPLVNFTSDELKQKIADHINTKVGGSQPSEEYRNCLAPGQTKVSASEIVLNVIPVRKVSGATDGDDIEAGQQGHQDLEILLAGNGDVYSSPLANFNVAYKHEATDLRSDKRAQDWEKKKPGDTLGKIVFDIDAVERRIDSLYKVNGKLSAKFKSELKKTSCTVSNTEDNNAAMGAAVGALVGGGFLGAAIGSQMFGGSESSTTTCTYNIVTEMVSGNVDVKIETEHTTDMEGKFKQVCIEDDCRNVPLADWVEKKLLAQFVLANMDIILKRVGDEVFASTTPKGAFNGRDGDTDVTINIENRLKENEYVDVSVNADVFKTTSMSVFTDMEMFKIPMVRCFAIKNPLQRRKYPSLGNDFFIPLDFSCANQ
jgi:hypothetical protein